MPQKKSFIQRQKRASCCYILILNELYKYYRVDHHFDDYQGIEEIT